MMGPGRKNNKKQKPMDRRSSWSSVIFVLELLALPAGLPAGLPAPRRLRASAPRPAPVTAVRVYG